MRVGQIVTVIANYYDRTDTPHTRSGLARVARVIPSTAIFFRFADRAGDYHGETKGGMTDSRGRAWGPLEGFHPSEITMATVVPAK